MCKSVQLIESVCAVEEMRKSGRGEGVLVLKELRE